MLATPQCSSNYPLKICVSLFAKAFGRIKLSASSIIVGQVNCLLSTLNSNIFERSVRVDTDIVFILD